MTTLSKRVLVTTVAAAALFTASTALAQTRRFDIPSEEAAKSIPEFARQAGVQITAPVSGLHGVMTPRITGQQDIHAALAALIANTGLEIASESRDVITLRRKAASASPTPADSPAPSDKQSQALQSDLASTAMEEVIVRASTPAGSMKRESDTVVDTITELEISRLPNLDLSDALTRLPGVHRNETQSGENRYVTIRGLDNAAASQSIDGVLLTNYVGSSRATSTEALSAQFIKNITVTPTVTPNIDENSNAANIAVTTISGLDSDGERVLDVQGFGGISNRSGGLQSTNTPVRGNVLWKGALDDANRIGLAAGFSVDQLGSRQDATSLSGFSNANGTFVPNGVLTHGPTFSGTDRISGFARLDFKLSPQIRLFGEYFRFVHDFKTDQYTSSATVSAASAQNVSGDSGQFPTASANYAFNGGGLDLRDHIIIVGGDYEIDPRSRLSFRANLTLNTTVSTSYGTSGFGAASTALTQPIQYTASDSALNFAPGAAASLSNPANYLLSGHVTLSDMVTNDHNYFFRTDYDFNSAPTDRGFGLKTGLQYKSLIRESEQRGGAYELAAGQGIRLSEVAGASSLSMFNPVAINSDALLKLIGERGMPVPDADGLYASDPANGFGQNFDASEQIGVGYLLTSYTTDRWRLSAGFRYAYTNRHLLDYEPNDAGLWQQQQYSQHYGDLLPSALGSFNILDNLKLRGAFTETLERPALSSASRNVLASYTTPPTITVSYSSPYLLPTKSNNFDATLDYYYGPHDAYVSIGGFYKYLTDIPGTSTNTTTDASGDILITSYKTNLTSVGGKSVHGTDQGLELIWSDPRIFFFPEQWGKLGTFVSFDYVVYKIPALNGGGGVPATNLIMVDGAPRDFFNGEIFYNFGPFVANLSYELQSGIPSYAYNPAANQQTIYGGLLDAQVSYAATSHLRFVAQGRNLTDQDIVNRYGVTDYSRIYQIRNDGRTLWLGAELTF